MNTHQSADLTVGSIRDYCVQFLVENLHLNAGKIDPDVDFDGLGLDSVMAVSLILQLEEWSGLDLGPSLLFEYPTINELAAHIAQAAAPVQQ